jgi:hypothetical protein
MKPSMLSLLIAAGAFGASTVYLAIQLHEERVRAEEVLAGSRALEQRIAELESLRAGFAVPSTQTGPPVRGAPGLSEVVAATMQPGATALEMEAVASAAARGPMPGPALEQSEAFRKMMRNQLRAQNKRLHADIGYKLGLTPEATNRLIDLLTDQQVRAMSEGARPRTPGSGPRNGAELHQAQLDEVAELIGYDKIDLYKDYQESLPARMEVATIARQLEGVDLQLDDSQRERLVTALAEERKRIPVPTFVQGTSPEEHVQALSAWQEDYQQRTETRVRSILNSQQLGTYEEYQQWTREMRAQFELRRIRGSEGAVMVAEPVELAIPDAPRP